MLRRLLNESDTTILGERNKTFVAAIKHQFPNVQTFKKSWHIFVKRKRKPLLPDPFSILTFPSSTEFDSVKSNNSNNLKNCAKIMEAQGNLSLGLSFMVHHGRVGGLHPTPSGCTGGKIGIRRKFSACFHVCLRISRAQNGDFHASDGVCQEYTYHSRKTHA